MTKSHIIGSAVAILAVASLGACQKPADAPVVDTAKAADAVKADLHDMLAAFNAHDVAKAVSHDTPDMVGMFHGAPNVVGVEQDTKMTTEQAAAGAKVEVADETVDVAASGDMAVYRATYTYSGTDPKTKATTTEKGNWVVGYKKIGDSWKIAWNVVSDTGPGSGVPAATAAPAAK
ncbi:hypothetical protein BH11PSE2_BH11PSE2_16790 [soil metagenome]